MQQMTDGEVSAVAPKTGGSQCGSQSFISDADLSCDKVGYTSRIIMVRDPHLFSPDNVAGNVDSG